MGYSERVCQICAISFNVSRIRRAGEPPEAAWDQGGRPGSFISLADSSDTCRAEGCTNKVPGAIVEGGNEELTSAMQEGVEDAEGKEHLAGPDCTCTLGYSGWRITAEEMKHCTALQCLSEKTPDWQPEADDEDFELTAERCFVTGSVSHGADEFNVEGLSPVRHGVSSAFIDNSGEAMSEDEQSALPMHPKCFNMFKRISTKRDGKVDIDGLWRLREARGDYENRFLDFPHNTDVDTVSEQWYDCAIGTEYLAADPVNIPGLSEMLLNSMRNIASGGDVVFKAPIRDQLANDPFARLSPELRHMLVRYLSRQDVANLRLVSTSLSELPQVYFRHLIETEMPWVWELNALGKRPINWHGLWCQLCAADGGAGLDAKGREWQQEILLAKNERFRHDLEERIKPQDPRFQPEWSEGYTRVKEEADAEIKAAYDNGTWPRNKTTELRGLRNRRRIWGDLEEIFRRIDLLDDDQ